MGETQGLDLISIGITISVGLLAIYAIYKNYFETTKKAINPEEYRKFKLISKKKHNT